MVRVLGSILLPAAVGLPFTLWLPSWLARISLAFLGGVVIVTAGLSAVGVVGLRFSVVSLAPVALVWLVAAAIAVRRTWPLVDLRPAWPRDWGWPAWVLLAVAGFNVAIAAAYAVRVPISIYDVVKFWLPKAEMISSSGFNALGQSVYPDYPPLWPLHIYLANGGGPWLKLLPSAYLVATLLIVFAYVRPRVGPTMAAASVLAISGVPYIWLPYGVNDLMSEIPMMAFVTASTIMLADYVDQPCVERAAIASLAAIGTVWVRPEGFFHAFLIGAILVVAGFRLHRLRQTVVPAGAIVVAYLAWRLVVRFDFQYAGGLGPNLSALTPSVVVSTLGDIIRYAAANIGNPYLFGPALIAVACLALGLTRWRSFGIVGLVLVVDIAIGVATYVALPSTDVGEPLIWWLTTGFKRMLMHFIPLLFVAAALAVGSLLQQRAAAAPTRKQPDWRRASVPAAAVGALAFFCIVVAGIAAYQVGGPKAFDLSEMGPSHVTGSTADYSTPGTISLPTTEGTDVQVIYYLQITGRRLPPLDNISGTFTRFSSVVAMQASSPVGERFVASADGRPIAEVTANPGSGPLTITGQIPLGTRLLELTISQVGPGTAVASWVRPTVYRASAWWAVQAFLLVALVLLGASGLVASGMVKIGDERVLGRLTPAVVSIPLLAAAAVQQAEAIVEVSMPAWSYAAGLVLRHL